jgi:hypothetical protein
MMERIIERRIERMVERLMEDNGNNIMKEISKAQ